MQLTKSQRKQVRDKSDGLCWYCGNKLPEKGWHADHVEPVRRSITKASVKDCGFGKVTAPIKALLDNGGMESPENDRIENIVPTCAPCNLFKSVYSIEEFRGEISLQIERARKYSVNFRTAERFGLIEATQQPVKFWFESQEVGGSDNAT